jgi:hypothetical protein
MLYDFPWFDLPLASSTIRAVSGASCDRGCGAYRYVARV